MEPEAEDAQPPAVPIERPAIDASEHIAPRLNRKAFHCPHCGVYAPQTWRWLGSWADGGWCPSHAVQGQCFNCERHTYWLATTAVETTEEIDAAVLVWPVGSASAPAPHPDFPPEPRRDYEEARGIVDRSARGATALLRLSLQKLCLSLGGSGQNLNQDIAALVANGLPPGVQQALDALRVIGNNAVHPGQMDLRDDGETAVALFGLLNFIVEQMIARPRELESIYAKLPASALAAIQQRDASSRV